MQCFDSANFNYKNKLQTPCVTNEHELKLNNVVRNQFTFHNTMQSSQEFCLDLFEPAGHGKRRRRSLEPDVQLPSAQKLVKKFNDSVPFTKFKENIEYTVLMPGDLYEKVAGLEGSCGSFFYLASGLGVLLVFSAFIMCYLASRLHSVTSGATHNKTIDDLVRERARKFSETQGYTGRSTVQ